MINGVRTPATESGGSIESQRHGYYDHYTVDDDTSRMLSEEIAVACQSGFYIFPRTYSMSATHGGRNGNPVDETHVRT